MEALELDEDEALRGSRVVDHLGTEPGVDPSGRVVKVKRTKTPAGKRWVQLPPFLAELYEALLDDCDRLFVFVGEQGGNLRRGPFARRFWRPAWDGNPDHPDPNRRVPPILPGFTFREGRHTHRTWLADDGIPEVGRAARLGHRMPGMAGVYEHVTPETKQRILATLQARWETSLLALRGHERNRLTAYLPGLKATILALTATRQAGPADGTSKMISEISPKQR